MVAVGFNPSASADRTTTPRFVAERRLNHSTVLNQNSFDWNPLCDFATIMFDSTTNPLEREETTDGHDAH